MQPHHNGLVKKISQIQLYFFTKPPVTHKRLTTARCCIAIHRLPFGYGVCSMVPTHLDILKKAAEKIGVDWLNKLFYRLAEIFLTVIRHF
ncbi:MAG TPA: hypothetical protein VF719_12330, partial [Abditibacteriaceae bacterium]